MGAPIRLGGTMTARGGFAIKDFHNFNELSKCCVRIQRPPGPISALAISIGQGRRTVLLGTISVPLLFHRLCMRRATVTRERSSTADIVAIRPLLPRAGLIPMMSSRIWRHIALLSPIISYKFLQVWMAVEIQQVVDTGELEARTHRRLKILRTDM